MQVLSRRRALEAPFDPHAYAALPVNGARSGVHDLYVEELGDGTAERWERARRVLLAYRLFPPARMRSCVCSEDGVVARGVDIVQRTLLGPVAIESAVRVTELVDEQTAEQSSLAFTYATLAGHPERGISTFRMVRPRAGALRFEIEVWSRSGHWLTRLGRPVSRGLQKAFTREALRHVREQVA